MPRRVQPIKRPEIRLDATSPTPLYKQLYERLRGAILTGQLERGARLPSTRALASELGVARMTTALAYQQLVLEGYLEGRVGQGTVVARSLPAMLVGAEIACSREERTDGGATPLSASLHAWTRSRTFRGLRAERGKLAGRFLVVSQVSIGFL